MKIRNAEAGAQAFAREGECGEVKNKAGKWCEGMNPDLTFQARNIVNDIKAAAAFLRKRGFKRIMYWADWNGMFAVDGKTQSSFFFPAEMSLEAAEKKISANRKLYGLSVVSH